MSINTIRTFCIRRRVTLGYIVAGLGLLFVRSPSKTLIAIGLVLILVGLILRSWSAGYINKSKELCREGPYALVRHPLYFGNTLIFLGFAVGLSSFNHLLDTLLIWGLCLGYLLTVYRWRIVFEENKLASLFGEFWRDYKKSVPCFWPKLLAQPQKSTARFSWKQWLLNKEYESVTFAVIVLSVLFFFANGN